MFDLYLKIIKTFAIFFLPLNLLVLFKRSIIIFTLFFFLITRALIIVLRLCCYCLFREGQNSTYVLSVWLNVHDCTSLLVQRQHTVLGKFRLAIGRELVSPSSKRMVPSPKTCHQNIIIATPYRTVVACRFSLQMFNKHCRFRHNTVSVKSFLLHHLFKWIDNTS